MRLPRSWFFLAVLAFAGGAAADPGSAISFQGELSDAGAPAQGAYDFEIALYAAASGGAAIDTRVFGDVAVEGGLFELEPDFTAVPFEAAAPYWLEVRVRAGTATGAYTPLLPRQRITPAPYALNAHSVRPAAIDAPALAPGAVGSAALAPGAVGSAALASNAVGSAALAPGAVGSAAIAPGAVGSAAIAPGAVGSSALAPSSVGSGAIAPNAVGSGAIAPGAVGSAAIAPGAVGAQAIDASQVQRRVGACAAGQYLRAVAADGTPTCVDAAAGFVTSVTAGSGLTGGGSGTPTLAIAPGGVTSAMIGDGLVATADLAPNAVTLAKIDTAQVQARVTGACAVGSSVRAINANGTVACEAGTAQATSPSFLDVPGIAGASAIAVGDDGLAIIAAHDVANGRLLALHCNDRACSSVSNTVVDTGNVGAFPSIAIVYGKPQIAYYDAANTALKLAVCQDAACSTALLRTLDNSGDVGEYAQMSLTGAGHAVVAYYDRGAGDLRMAACNNTACASPVAFTVDTGAGNDVGRHVSIFTSGSRVLVGYRDVTAGHFKIAGCFVINSCSSPHVQVADAAAGTGTLIASSGTTAGTARWWWMRNNTLVTATCTFAYCSTLEPSINVASNRAYTTLAATRDALGHGMVMGRYPTNTSEFVEINRCNDVACTSLSGTLNFNYGPGISMDAQGGFVLGGHGAPIYTVRQGSTLSLNLCSNDFCNTTTRR